MRYRDNGGIDREHLWGGTPDEQEWFTAFEPEFEPELPEATTCPDCCGRGFTDGDGFSEDTETCCRCGGGGVISR